MKRLILVNRYFHPDESGTAQFGTDLARHLASRCQVLALTSRQRLEDPDARLAASDALHGVSIRRLWSTRFGRRGLAGRALDYLSFLVAVFLWLLFHARRGDIVLAKTDPPLLGVVTTLATLGRGVRRVQWLQDLYPETAIALRVVRADSALALLTRALRDWSLKRSDLLVTVSNGIRAEVSAVPGHARLEHIPNWADDFGPDAGAGRPIAAGAQDLSARDFVVGYCGNLGRAYPINALLQLADGPADPGLRFLISGGGANHERLRTRVAELKRSEWTFRPYQPRETLGELLRSLDLHLVIHDRRTERYLFPSKLFSSLAAGRPVLHLGNPEGELGRLLRELGCGWSVSADSADALRAKLRELRAAPELLAQAGQRARRAYETRFSKADALARWDQSLGGLESDKRV